MIVSQSLKDANTNRILKIFCFVIGSNRKMQITIWLRWNRMDIEKVADGDIIYYSNNDCS